MLQLTKPLKIHISKRYYPGNGPKTSSEIVPYVLPKPNNTVIVPYNSHAALDLMKYRNTHNPQLAAAYINKLPQKAQEEKPSITKVLEKGTKMSESAVQARIAYLNNKEPKIEDSKKLQQFIVYKIESNLQISEEYLKKVLDILNNNSKKEKENLIELETTIFLLRKYFENNNPSIENAKKFLQIWHKSGFNFTPLSDIGLPKNIENPIENKAINTTVQNTKSYEDKKQETLNNKQTTCELINTLFLQYKDDQKKIIESQEIKHWYDYLQNRTSAVPLSEEEILIYNKLKALKEKFAPSEEILLNGRKDRLDFLKKNSQLPLSLQEEALNKCYLPEDYDLEIKKYNETLQFLKTKENLSLNDLKLLSINSSATIIDEEGTFKITQEAYQSFVEIGTVLGFHYSNTYPDFERIMSQIKNNDFLIFKENVIKPNAIVSVAHLSHKSLVVLDTVGYVRIGLFTSTKDNNTIKIDDTQCTNPDSTKRQKAQMFRGLSTPIVVAKEENCGIDLEATLYMHGLNNKGQPINEKLIKVFSEKQDIWLKNAYQFSYTADYDFIRKLTIIFYEKKLQILREDSQKLKEELILIYNKDQDLYETKIKELKVMKNQEILDKKAQQYFSLLPTVFQDLIKNIKLFEMKLAQDQEKKKKKTDKQRMKEAIAHHDIAKKEEQANTGEKTAKQKREEYLHMKRKENENKIQTHAEIQ